MKKTLVIFMCIFTLGVFAQNQTSPYGVEHDTEFAKIQTYIENIDLERANSVIVVSLNEDQSAGYPAGAEVAKTYDEVLEMTEPQFIEINGLQFETNIIGLSTLSDSDGFLPPALLEGETTQSYIKRLAHIKATEVGVYHDYVVIVLGGSETEVIFSRIEARMSTDIQENIEMEPFVSIYPNPASNYIKIAGLSNEEKQIVSIFDSNGKVVKRFRSIKNHDDIDISDLTPGHYIVQVRIKKSNINERFIITR